MQLNKKMQNYTHEGGKAASNLTPLQQLRRTVMACLLWENNFYEDGEAVVERIKRLVPLVDPVECSKLACDAREDSKLRHVPLLIAREMARHPTHRRYVSRLLQRIITRPDQMGEFLAMYWADDPEDKRSPLSLKVRDGLRRIFEDTNKFTEYNYAKYDRNTPVKLRDVMFLVRPKPQNEQQVELFKHIANRTLKTPDTWEVALSGGADKRATFERLMAEGTLGELAFLRNLRNMHEAEVPATAILDYAVKMDVKLILPFQVIAAHTQLPAQYGLVLEALLQKSVKNVKRLPGSTVVLVDVSGSMFGMKLSAKNTMDRFDAAAALAIMLRDICEKPWIFTFSHILAPVHNIRGLPLRDALLNSQGHGGTNMRGAVQAINTGMIYDRIIIITDEQSHDGIAAPKGHGYVINIANCQNGVGYGPWTHIDGFSQATINYIQELEHSNAAQ